MGRRRLRGVAAAVALAATAAATLGAAVAGPGAAPAGARTRASNPVAQVVTAVVDAARWIEGPAADLASIDAHAHLVEAGIGAALRQAIDTLDDSLGAPGGLEALLQDAYDSLLHMKPDVPFTHAPDAGNPATAPDWDGDGRYGEGADYRLDIDQRPDVGRFRYPCTGYDGAVSFQRTDGRCVADPGPEAATGVARELAVVDGRGLRLDATIWIPGAALRRPCAEVGVPRCADPSNVRPGRPSVVFHDGLVSRQDHYYWYATALARAGYVVLTYDPAGQGESEGTVIDLFASGDGCSGSCMDAQDVHRWWMGEDVARAPVVPSRPFVAPADPRYLDEGGDNVRNPYLAVLDRDRVAISGNSMGAAATVSYLNALTDGHGYDRTGRPVPPVAAAVPLSVPGATRISAPVPVLMVTGDLDGFPLVGPAVLGTGWADDAERMFDRLRGNPRTQAAIGVVVIEGGVHTDHVTQTFIPSTPWGVALTEHYAVAWLDCHVRGAAAACDRTLRSAPRLSGAFASRVDPDGAGPAPVVCLAAPSRASLGHEVPVLLDAVLGRHAPCAG